MQQQHSYIPLPHLRLHYRDWGGQGRPLVLIHGLASNARIWDLAAPILAENFAVVALDQRGHGLSDHPDEGYDFATISGDLESFLQMLGISRPVLVGHSWGGNVALEYTAKHPSAVAALVLVDGGFMQLSAIPGMTWERAEREMAPPPLAGTPLEDFRQRIRQFLPPDAYSPEVEEIILGNFQVDAEQRIYPHLTRERHMKILRSLWEQNPTEMYAQVDCPVLLVPAAQSNEEQARGDPSRLELKRRAVSLAEQSLVMRKTVWMENTIHDIPLQRPRELVAEITEFVHRYTQPD